MYVVRTVRLCPVRKKVSAYVFLFPSTMRSGTFSETKSSSEGPSANVSVKELFFGAGDPEAAGIASARACLDIGTRATREYLRMVDIVAWERELLGSSVIGMPAQRRRSYGPLGLSPSASTDDNEHAVSTRRGYTFEDDKGECP